MIVRRNLSILNLVMIRLRVDFSRVRDGTAAVLWKTLRALSTGNDDAI